MTCLLIRKCSKVVSVCISNTNAGILLKVCGLRCFGICFRMKNDHILSVFFSLFASFSCLVQTVAVTMGDMLYVHAGWITFLMAPRAVVLAIKNCCNSVKAVIENTFLFFSERIKHLHLLQLPGAAN